MNERPGNPERLPFRAFILAIGVGFLAAAGGSVLLELIHLGERFFYQDLPTVFGWDELPLWWIGLMLFLGASIVVVAQRLPGHSGKSPLTGFHFDTPPQEAVSILLAALGTLVFGFVLGPEAPLIILGTTIGALIARRMDSQTARLAMLIGGVAAIGAVFGNPFVTAFMILEFVALGAMPAITMLPLFVALGSGYLTQVGIGAWDGFGVHPLSVPNLPSYEAITVVDLLVAVLAAMTAAVVAAIARELAERCDRVTRRQPAVMPFAGAVVVIGLLAVATFVFDLDPAMILFSGQGESMSTLIGESSIGLVIAIIAIKGVAYAVSLGSGFRGGPIFPATFLGVGVGVLFSLLFAADSVSPLAAAGIAATATVMTRLPFTSGMLAVLLIGGAGMDIAPFAIIGAVVGFAVRQSLDAYDRDRSPQTS